MNLTRDLVSTNDAKDLPRPEPKKQAQSDMVDSRLKEKGIDLQKQKFKIT